MKILQVNCVYKKGSTGKITADIHSSLLAQGIESVVCYGRGEKANEPYVYKTCGEFESYVNHFIANATGVMYGANYFATKRLECIIKKETPDLVHLQCINGYFVNIYKIVEWLKKNHIKTILTLHAEFMYTANCGHALECNKWKTGCGHCPRLKKETGSYFFDGTAISWKKMKKAFDGFGNDLTIVSVSPWLMERAKQSPILSNFHHCVVYNGLDTDVFHVYPYADLKKKHHLQNEKIIFHATPSFSLEPDHLKGGRFVFQLAEKMKNDHVKFIVAGPYDPSIKIPDNVIMLGKVTDQHLLAQYYSMADITLLTSQKETFSMVTAESLCCGTPVVGFKAGAPEQIALQEYSRFVDYPNINDLHTSCLSLLNSVYDSKTIECSAHSRYSKRKAVGEYEILYQK